MSQAVTIDLARPHKCAYCGEPTSMAPTRCTGDGQDTVWPACCAGCVDKWESVPASDVSPEVLKQAFHADMAHLALFGCTKKASA